MCIGYPMRLAEAEGEHAAWCEGRLGRRRVDLSLVGRCTPGTWLLVHADAAREVLDPQRADAIDRALQALSIAIDGALDGDADASAAAIDACFPDLAGRTPQLPPHLRAARGDLET